MLKNQPVSNPRRKAPIEEKMAQMILIRVFTNDGTVAILKLDWGIQIQCQSCVDDW
jgi:hypothetical protein